MFRYVYSSRGTKQKPNIFKEICEKGVNTSPLSFQGHFYCFRRIWEFLLLLFFFFVFFLCVFFFQNKNRKKKTFS